jgi:hypothetical protein
MEIREFKKGESILDHCRECKGLMYEDEGEATICMPCMINLTRGKVMSKRVKKEKV